MSAPILALQGVTVRFGGLTALSALDLEVAPGETVGLIGPNGAGKTTLFNVITGTLRPQAGSVRLRGERIDGLRPSQIARRAPCGAFVEEQRRTAGRRGACRDGARRRDRRGARFPGVTGSRRRSDRLREADRSGAGRSASIIMLPGEGRGPPFGATGSE